MKCNSSKCNGATIPYTLIDGYYVGDRLLEQVMFQIYYNNGKISVTVDLSCTDYFGKFNKSKWYKDLENYTARLIKKKDFTYFSCPICNEEECIEI